LLSKDPVPFPFVVPELFEPSPVLFPGKTPVFEPPVPPISGITFFIISVFEDLPVPEFSSPCSADTPGVCCTPFPAASSTGILATPSARTATATAKANPLHIFFRLDIMIPHFLISHC
jgi:hypothetical protein